MMYGDPQQQVGDFHRGPPMRQPSASSTNVQPDYLHSNAPPLPPTPYEGNMRPEEWGLLPFSFGFLFWGWWLWWNSWPNCFQCLDCFISLIFFLLQSFLIFLSAVTVLLKLQNLYALPFNKKKCWALLLMHLSQNTRKENEWELQNISYLICYTEMAVLHASEWSSLLQGIFRVSDHGARSTWHLWQDEFFEA